MLLGFRKAWLEGVLVINFMIKIKYNNKNNFEEVKFSRNENIVSLKGTTENNSGFKTYRMSGEQLGDFSDYTTTYRLLDNEVQYSNDGSVWTEPEPYEPTPEEQINDLKNELEKYDYIGTKIAMGVATKEDYADEITYTETLRQKIRELEDK